MCAIAFCGGVIAGGASAAFYLTLRMFNCFVKNARLSALMCGCATAGAVTGAFCYFVDLGFTMSVPLVTVLGTAAGIFVGAYIARIAEVVDALGAANDMKIYAKAFLISFVVGKLFGSILYWVWF